MSAPERAPLPVTVVCGFLGAGKTTLLTRLLRDRPDRRFGLIVHDLSALAVDAEQLTELREERGEPLIALSDGALGGALRPALTAALAAMAADPRVDYLLVETSGSTQPASLVADILANPALRLDTFATVVDGLNLLRDHDGGHALVPAARHDPASTAALLLAQIEAASVLLVSKADRLTRPQAQAMLALLHALNPRALIVTMAYGQVDPSRVLASDSWHRRIGAVPRAGFAALPDDPAHYDLGAEVVRETRPFHPTRLHALFTEGLPLGVHRSKGWLWLASRPLDVLTWNQAGSYVSLGWAGTWKAGILDDPAARLGEEERRMLAAQVFAIDPEVGDRHCELTVIGHRGVRARFVEALRGCVLTDEEMAAWRGGAVFADPWPTTFRRV